MPVGHINNLKDAQAMKSSFDRIRKKEEADSRKKTGSLKGFRMVRQNVYLSLVIFIW